MSKVLLCWDDLEVGLQSIAEFGPRIFKVDGPENLGSKLKAQTGPAVGVAYERMVRVPDKATPQGRTTVAGFGLYLAVDAIAFAQGVDMRGPALELLERMRKVFLGRRSPAGHFWQFEAEMFADNSGGKVYWVQRWSTPVINEAA